MSDMVRNLLASRAMPGMSVLPRHVTRQHVHSVVHKAWQTPCTLTAASLVRSLTILTQVQLPSKRAEKPYHCL